MADTGRQTLDAAGIQQWLIETLSHELKVDPSEIDPEKRLSAYGLDSLQLISMVGQLEEHLGCRFTSNPLPLHPTIGALSRFLAERLRAGVTEIDPTHEGP